ncbi:hypothetical protein GCM10011502_25890 [Oceanisphaera marina]|uniref:Glyoxalase/fosfomycin resistance/dioxygenase domain-containing protein n=1 Tax=Oceanisphaera marina TaxID=2017550 RepID=A0ABQ1IUG3_9GAMM|nr:VOC family protein [Oceanisphaera marina]GGB51592.1 hypothetical protein GCM10011502_25890 [Oceanisphaera marina]
MANVYPRNFSHIGISVPDLDAAVTFYTEVMGWYLIMAPTEISEDDSAIGEMCTGYSVHNGKALKSLTFPPVTALA